MNHDPLPTRRKRLAFRVFLLLLGVLMVISALGSLTESFPSVAYARAEGEPFRRVAGGESHSVHLAIGYTDSQTNSCRGSSSPNESGHPLQLLSLTILDASGADLSSRVAHLIMEQAREIGSIRYVDVRIPSSPLETTRIGDLVLVVEELDSKPGYWFGEWV